MSCWANIDTFTLMWYRYTIDLSLGSEISTFSQTACVSNCREGRKGFLSAMEGLAKDAIEKSSIATLTITALNTQAIATAVLRVWQYDRFLIVSPSIYHHVSQPLPSYRGGYIRDPNRDPIMSIYQASQRHHPSEAKPKTDSVQLLSSLQQNMLVLLELTLRCEHVEVSECDIVLLKKNVCSANLPCINNFKRINDSHTLHHLKNAHLYFCNTGVPCFCWKQLILCHFSPRLSQLLSKNKS